jgi:hypothetical protein
MTTFNRQIQEDFSGIPSLAHSSDSSGGTTTTNILSRYSNLSSDDDAIKNFDQINMGLTSHYATRNSSGQKFAWSQDDISNNANSARGAFDRYIWSGAIETDSSGNSIFKPANIDSKDTDGFMMIPSPYFPFVPGSRVMANTFNPQDSMRIKLKFNSLPANTFVPLFGFVYSTISSPDVHSNSQETLYRSNRKEMYGSHTGGTSYVTSGYDRHYNVPGAIASDSNNLYQSYSNQSYWQNDYVKNTVLWFMYAHDGNGNGMVATCAGEVDSSDPATHQMRPTNEYFGSDNGYLKFKSPKVIDDFLASNSLSDLWDYYGTGGAGQASLGASDSRREMRQVYHYHREDPLDIQSTTGAGTWAANLASIHSLSTGGVQYSSPYNSCGSLWVNSTYNSWGNYPGDLNYSHLQLISYGPTNNSTFSNAEEILINANLISQYRKAIGLYGLSDTNGMASQTWNGCQYLYTGKILDFTFRDTPGQMFFDTTPGHGRHKNCDGAAGSNYHTNDYSGLGPSALVLRPTVTGDGEIHSFSYANYDSSGSKLIGGGGLNSNYYCSSDSTQYVFPSEGHSYDPILSTTLDDPSGNWINPSNLVDDDVSTTAELTETGESNALFLSLNGTSASLSASESEYKVSSLTVNVRGVTLSGFTNHLLNFSIVDSSKNSNVHYRKEGVLFFNDIIEVPQNSMLISPTTDGAFSLVFESTDLNSVSYPMIKDGFLKIWAEPINSPSSIPYSISFSNSLKGWSVELDHTGSNSASVELDGVKLPTTTNVGVISKTFNTTVGTTYTVSWEDIDITTSCWTKFYANTADPSLFDSNNSSLHSFPTNGDVTGSKFTTFTATNSITEIAFIGAGSNGVVKINNIKIQPHPFEELHIVGSTYYYNGMNNNHMVGFKLLSGSGGWGTESEGPLSWLISQPVGSMVGTSQYISSSTHPFDEPVPIYIHYRNSDGSQGALISDERTISNRTGAEYALPRYSFFFDIDSTSTMANFPNGINSDMLISFRDVV